MTLVEEHTLRVLTPEQQARWDRRVQRAGPDECWLWDGVPDSIGYASLTIGGRSVRAHRIAYEMAHGPIPKGRHIDHICRVKLCLNPRHLRLATPQQNSVNSPSRSGTSHFKGVSGAGDRWKAFLQVDGRNRTLGTYLTEEEAATAYDAAALNAFGEFAFLNFPGQERPEPTRLRGEADRTHCPAGHPYDDENTYVYVNASGGRRRNCRACHRTPGRLAAVEPELSPELKRFNAAEPSCEACHGIGTYRDRKCPCIPRSAR